MSAPIQTLPQSQGVYLLHYERPYPAGRQPRHYLGTSTNIANRVTQHAHGTSGARLPEVMHDHGIRFEVARLWLGGTIKLERRLHRYKKLALLCPVCAQRVGRQPRQGRERATAPTPLRLWWLVRTWLSPRNNPRPRIVVLSNSDTRAQHAVVGTSVDKRRS